MAGKEQPEGWEVGREGVMKSERRAWQSGLSKELRNKKKEGRKKNKKKHLWVGTI